MEEKGCSVEILLDTIGDVLTYPYLIDLVKKLKKTNGVKSVALETHGLLLTKKLVDRLAEAGLDRVNLSIDMLNQDKARYLYGTPIYDIERITRVVEYLVKETPIDLHVTPLWLPGINDNDIIEVLNWAMRIGAGKKWPPVTVQKFIRHRYGRGHWIREIPWSHFWRYLERLENIIGVKLRYDMSEWGMHYAQRIRQRVSKGDLLEVKVFAKGWLRGEYIGVTRDFLLAIYPRSGVRLKTGLDYLVEVVDVKDSIYSAKVVKQIYT